MARRTYESRWKAQSSRPARMTRGTTTPTTGSVRAVPRVAGPDHGARDPRFGDYLVPLRPPVEFRRFNDSNDNYTICLRFLKTHSAVIIARKMVRTATCSERYRRICVQRRTFWGLGNRKQERRRVGSVEFSPRRLPRGVVPVCSSGARARRRAGRHETWWSDRNLPTREAAAV